MSTDGPHPAADSDDTATDAGSQRSVALRIGVATFGILALELALIRWTSGQIRIFAYFSNLVLIGAFLGMGLGVALGRRHPGLVHWTLPVLCVLSIPLAFAPGLGLVQMSFPDRSISLWGADGTSDVADYLRSLVVFLGLFCLIVAVFALAGSPVGRLFSRISTLRAYSADLLGSLLGIVAFTLATFSGAEPPVWFLLGGLPFAWLSRRRSSFVALAGVVLLSWYSAGDAVYSPYNRIDAVAPPGKGALLIVNRDFHQVMHDLSDQHLADSTLQPEHVKLLRHARDVYDMPFQLNDARASALVVGAGTGNDVQAALRNGYGKVVSVDIDGAIIRLGRELHPEKVYDHPAVVPVVNDARAFFQQYEGEPFDAVCYGLVDSHAMFSAMSTLRLESYIYSEEGIRSAWRHVSKRGHLSISFSMYAGEWIAHRLYWTIARATGKRPAAVYHGLHFGVTFIVAGDESDLNHDRLAAYRKISPPPESTVATVTDDWPFLYCRPGVFPWGYIIVLGCVVILALIATPLAFGRASVTTRFDPVLFLMGAAFLLIETKGVTSLSLLFGSTWLVNSSIFAGILTMVLLANLAVERFGLRRPLPWFGVLLGSVVLLWALDVSVLNRYPLLVRGVSGGLLSALPIGFAGIIVSILLVRSSHPTASLGSNLLGAVVGGCLEYVSMYLGLKAIVLIALALYLGAFGLLARRRPHRRDQEPERLPSRHEEETVASH